MIVRLLEPVDLSAVENILIDNGMNAVLAPSQFVAERGGEIVGTGGLWDMDQYNDLDRSVRLNCGWITSVAVRKGHKRTGVGGSIIRATMALADRRGYGSVWLETYFWNSRFYQSLGFEGIDPALVAPVIKDWRLNKHCRFMTSMLTRCANAS